jgi:hypothetical protein
MNVAPITRYFKDVAQHAIKRMKDELAGGGGVIWHWPHMHDGLTDLPIEPELQGPR